jgi:hypothetical protein
MKADGSPGSSPRLNQAAAREAAAGYCKNMVNSKWILKRGASPAPAVVTGKAEGEKSMILSIMWYEPSCAKDKHTDVYDFGKISVDTCMDNMITALSATCKIDKSWGAKWNKDYELQGGVWANDCAMYSLYGG